MRDSTRDVGCRRATTLGTAVALGLALVAATLAAQPPQTPTPPPPGIAISVEPSGETATLSYANRPIVVLRARIMGRPPSERAALAVRALDNIVESGQTGPVSATFTSGGFLIGVGPQVVVGLTTLDVDELAGETLQGVADEAVRRMQQAVDEAVEARRVGTWFRAIGLAVTGLTAGGLLLWALGRARRRVSDGLSKLIVRSVGRAGLTDQHANRAIYLLDFLQRRTVSTVVVGLRLLVAYMLATFVLRQLPYTRPWGESLREFMLATLSEVATNAVNAIPELFTIFIIVLVIRFVTKLLEPWFDAVERGAITVSYMHSETAPTTRRLVTIALWLFAAALAYPYVPGSDTEAFKGISVFVGLVVTLGSSGFVNQIMSGFMIVYSRALRVGDFVKLGDIEGTITHLGVLSTKLRTPRSEEVTIPNALVVSQTATDYSRFAEAVLTLTSVTIGYDAPWRQVHAMLLLAAERTPGIRRDPKPRVLQAALEDKAVKYTLTFCLENQQSRIVTLSALHANVQDLFNEYGVQIMTPSYEGDPAAPKVVSKQDWYAAPARPDPGR
jgi:small-conductance mechanosensitive channel